MAELTIATAVITGLVGAYKAYTEYKAATFKATEAKAPPPAKSDDAAKGEHAAEIIKVGVAQHGDADEQADLASFERNPERYASALSKVLADIAAREPAFAHQLQTVAQQANIQTGGVQGNVNVSGQGKIIGTAVGVNEGTISGTYTVNDDDQPSGTKG
jgi:hypothetical protein